MEIIEAQVVEDTAKEIPEVVETVAKAKSDVTGATIIVGALAIAGCVFVAEKAIAGVKKVKEIVAQKTAERLEMQDKQGVIETAEENPNFDEEDI